MLNPTEEAKFKELKDKCRELKVPAPPEIFIGLQVHENGVLVFDDKQRGHSWTRNFYNILFSLASSVTGDGGASFGAGYMSATYLNGTKNSSTTMSGYHVLNATSLGYGFLEDTTTGTFGIKVGTDDTAFSVEQYALGAVIAPGTGSGQFSHAAMGQAAKTYTAGTKTWKGTLTRIFNNNSGASITAKEVGLYWNGGVFNASMRQYMLERSVLSPTVAVANGAQLTVTYEISMDFSAID